MHTKFLKHILPIFICLPIILLTACTPCTCPFCSSGDISSSSSESAQSSQPDSSSSQSVPQSSQISSIIISSDISSSSDLPDNMYSGIDVSEYQGNIDFEQVKSAGVELVYIRAGEGNNITDSQFETNYQNATDAGLKIGFYYYVTATTTQEAAAQANRFYSLINNKTYAARPVMDYESYGNLTNAQINEIATTFLVILDQLTGVGPAIYSDAYRVKTLWDESLSAYPLWIADYSTGQTLPPSTGYWTTWAGYQYSDSGTVNGISTHVDLDLFKTEILI